MKLLVIVLCLLSERFLVHVGSHNRFRWFSVYGKAMDQRLAQISFLSSSWLMLVLVVLPLLLVFFIALHFFSNGLFGFVGFLLNVIIFFFCLGPGNPFYPVRAPTTENVSDVEIGEYLVQANGQLFAVLFWYIILGPLAVLAYRLISHSQSQPAVSQSASRLTSILDWLPARMTVLLYLLVGNFQAGLRNFSKIFFSAPANNNTLLSVCGMQALGSGASDPVAMPHAESLVEHAIIVLLVLLAFFTLVAWM